MNKNLVTLCLLVLAPVALVTAADQPRLTPVSIRNMPREDLTDDHSSGQDMIAYGSDRWANAGDFTQGDYLSPPKGKYMATMVTGIPFIGIGEVAYGFTNRFSVGILAGELGNFTPGYGLRFRYVLAQPSQDFRLYFKAPVIYYPQDQPIGCPDCEPWFLTWPTVNAEWRLAGGSRLWAGVGVVAAACATTVLGSDEEQEEMAEGRNEGVWNTIQFGISRPLTRRITFQFEAAVVLKGLKLASRDNWLGGPPVILTIGFTHVF